MIPGFLRLKHWDRYILSRFLLTFLGTLFLLVVVIVLSELTTRMNSILSSKADPIHFYNYLVLRIPRFISFAVPAAIMFSVSFTITQFTRTNEMLAVMAAGFSYYRALLSVFIAGLAICLLLFVFNELVVGDAENRSQYEWRMVRGEKTIAEKDIFNLHLKDKNIFYYFNLYKPGKKRFKAITFSKFDKRGLIEYEVRAPEAEWDKQRQDWKFINGYKKTFDQNLELVSDEKFDFAYFQLPSRPSFFQQETRHADAMDLKYLNQFIPLRKKAGLDATPYEILWHERFAIPYVGIIVLFIGALVGRALGKASMAGSLGVTIGVVLFYFVVQSFGKSLGKQGLFSVWVGVWMANMIFSSVTLFWFVRFRS